MGPGRPLRKDTVRLKVTKLVDVLVYFRASKVSTQALPIRRAS